MNSVEEWYHRVLEKKQDSNVLTRISLAKNTGELYVTFNDPGPMLRFESETDRAFLDYRR
jgi:hypothetical protein